MSLSCTNLRITTNLFLVGVKCSSVVLFLSLFCIMSYNSVIVLNLTCRFSYVAITGGMTQ